MSEPADARDLRKCGENWRNVPLLDDRQPNLSGDKLCRWLSELKFQTVSIGIGASKLAVFE
jgi:hypothetical protein